MRFPEKAIINIHQLKSRRTPTTEQKTKRNYQQLKGLDITISVIMLQ